MTLLQAVVYGVVQGIGEFLPISSSAHLLLVPWLFGWEDPGLAFGVALHMGTLFAVIIYFWRDWLDLVAAGLGLQKNKPVQRRLFWMLAFATIPAALAGFFFEDVVEKIFRSPLVVAFALIALGLLLYQIDRTSSQKVNLKRLRFGTALGIGVAQAFAIIPGVSRSGATMTAARFFGLKREDAARFSFLLSLPIILGAGILQVPKLDPQLTSSLPFWVGLITAALSGYASISFLLRYLSTRNFGVFAAYRCVLGLVIIVLFFMRGGGL